MKFHNAMVRNLIARHAGWSPSAIRPWHRLESDLDLTPLELVLITIDLEELLGTEIPLDGLSALETVGELERFFAHAARRAPRAGSLPSVA
jgi:acyl carrier protein